MYLVFKYKNVFGAQLSKHVWLFQREDTLQLIDEWNFLLIQFKLSFYLQLNFRLTVNPPPPQRYSGNTHWGCSDSESTQSRLFWVF